MHAEVVLGEGGLVVVRLLLLKIQERILVVSGSRLKSASVRSSPS
jgi:hypothetical protein